MKSPNKESSPIDKKNQQGFFTAAAFYALPWGTIIPILIIIGAIGGSVWWYGEKQYKAGKAKCDETWTQAYNKMIEEKNAKIIKLEGDSSVAATNNSKDVSALKDQIAKLLAAGKVRGGTVNKPHDETGAVLKCGDKEVAGETYLGIDFSTQWNQLVKTINAQLLKKE